MGWRKRHLGQELRIIAAEFESELSLCSEGADQIALVEAVTSFFDDFYAVWAERLLEQGLQPDQYARYLSYLGDMASVEAKRALGHFGKATSKALGEGVLSHLRSVNKARWQKKLQRTAFHESADAVLEGSFYRPQLDTSLRTRAIERNSIVEAYKEKHGWPADKEIWPRAHVSAASYYAFKRGKRLSPRILRRIAAVLEVPPEKLL